jgi:TRAP-type mannitol/chloroaromatic compound transport system substrate-binding protein
MKRRDILAAAAAIATGTATLTALSKGGDKDKAAPQSNRSELGAPAITKGIKQLRMVTTWPKDFPGLGAMPNRIAKSLKLMSEGRLEIKVYAAGELVGALEAFDAVSSGAADMYHGAEYYWQGKSKGFTFFTAVPMGMTASALMGWVDFGGGQELWDELSGKFNIKPLAAGNTGHQSGGWFKKEINSLEDFKGLKMRMPGLGGEVLRRIGAAAINLPGGEIYQALQSGAIDATEWVGPWNDLAFGFYREAPHYYAPGFHEPGAGLAVGTNLKVWNGFTPAEQMMVREACKSVNHQSLGEYSHENALALNTLKTDHGIAPKFFSDEILMGIGKASIAVMAEQEMADKMTAKIYRSYWDALSKARKWTEMGDGRYIRARQLAMDV